ncbi:MAG: hypothetical protein GWN76_08490 [candidate division Zixibacteria bacterium]|nr:hypothetical protein [candidate division Zixibacteria bacterium]NIU14036.1 hypothetical protein [candidate division Zixibacteria bacterium]
MCRTAKEIREADFTCIALDEYISFRKREINGDKNSLAYFDVLRAEAEIENRITTLQIGEDMIEKFDEVKETISCVKEEVEVCEDNIGKVKDKLDNHLTDLKENPTMWQRIKEKPLKAFTWLSGIMVGYYIILSLVAEWIGFGNLLAYLISKLPVVGGAVPTP